MAFPTAVNSQITDAVTQTGVKVLADAPAQAMAGVYQSVAHATNIAMQNAVAHQQNVNNLGLAVTTRCINTLLGVPQQSS